MIYVYTGAVFGGLSFGPVDPIAPFESQSWFVVVELRYSKSLLEFNGFRQQFMNALRASWKGNKYTSTILYLSYS